MQASHREKIIRFGRRKTSVFSHCAPGRNASLAVTGWTLAAQAACHSKDATASKMVHRSSIERLCKNNKGRITTAPLSTTSQTLTSVSQHSQLTVALHKRVIRNLQLRKRASSSTERVLHPSRAGCQCSHKTMLYFAHATPSSIHSWAKYWGRLLLSPLPCSLLNSSACVR